MKPKRIRAAGVVINNGRIALIHRKKDGYEYWVFPGGGIKEGETGEEAVAREVKEETSLTCIKVNYAFDVRDEKSGNKHPYYLCEVEDGEVVLGGPEAEKNSEENWYHSEWISLSKVKKLNILPKDSKDWLLKYLPDK